MFCRKHYPQDLHRVLTEFPEAEKILFDYLSYDPKYEQGN